MAIYRHVSHIKSRVVTDGNPKLPTSDSVEYGEIAINYAKDHETISIKNDEDEIVTFSSDSQIKVTIDEDLDSGSTNPVQNKAVYEALEKIDESSGFENGEYVPKSTSSIISGATSLTDAINKLDTAVASGGTSAKYTITVSDEGVLEILKDGENAITVDTDGTLKIG